MANSLNFIKHPKAKQHDVTQSFDNGLVDEAIEYPSLQADGSDFVDWKSTPISVIPVHTGIQVS